MNNLIIIGAGGVGRETKLIVNKINEKNKTWNLIGFIDDDKSKWQKIIDDAIVIGGMDCLSKITEKVYLVVAIADYKTKKAIVEKVQDRFEFATIIHPNVNVYKNINIGNGSIIYEGVVLTTNIKIGEHVIISPKCGIGHDSIINDYVSLLWNVNISGNDKINEGVMFGSGSTIIQGKTVGKGAKIGAGAVVINDIPEEATAVGVPAKIIKIEK